MTGLPIVTMWVEGAPVTQGSKSPKPIYGGKPCGCCKQRRLLKLVVAESDKLAPWRHRVATKARVTMAGREPMTGPVIVLARFYLPRPQDHLGTGRNAGQLRPSAPQAWEHVKKPDGDKLLRAVLDAMTGIVYHDDAQVIDSMPRKRYADPGQSPGVRLTIKPANYSENMP